MNEIDFIRESNRIEGITRDPTQDEIYEFQRFMALMVIERQDLEKFVSIYQPGAKLRNQPGMDVRVGSHKPFRGGQMIVRELDSIIFDVCNQRADAYLIHRRYETLHPFMDCNGRSGRMLWAWQVRDFSIGFLHRYYYQSLDNSRH